MQFPDFKNEIKYLGEGFEYVAGCDEVGRGPLAGPVVAAACILDPESLGGNWHARVRDSKTMSEKEREEILPRILENALAYGVGEVGQREIDEINIHNASLLAMERAVEDLKNKMKSPGTIFILTDGRFIIPNLGHAQKAMVKGDAQVLSIAAASIIAKVHRDKIMKSLHTEFPEYGFGAHKGYGTKAHYQALQKFGITSVHRKSFLKV